jgi:hypothetical protein
LAGFAEVCKPFGYVFAQRFGFGVLQEVFEALDDDFLLSRGHDFLSG